MGFNFNQSAGSANAGTAATAGTQQNSRGFEKAAAFINIGLPKKDGSTTKLGAIPLRISNPNEKAVMEWLASNPDAIELLRQKFVLNFRMVSENNGSDLDL